MTADSPAPADRTRPALLARWLWLVAAIIGAALVVGGINQAFGAEIGFGQPRRLKLDAFWLAVTEWSGVRWHDASSGALAERVMPGARWFDCHYGPEPGAPFGRKGAAIADAPQMAVPTPTSAWLRAWEVTMRRCCVASGSDRW